ncbi:hypothetical protein KEJ49_04215 [Candidatus Bathyarchaeota archaeon]|nr:hypothetical protein [Candidatus Bathyarchaeota archaeon]
MGPRRVKVLALFSGGLDSTLAVGIAQRLGFEVEAVHFTTPFCVCDKCRVEEMGRRLGLRVHHVFLGEEFLDLLMDPPHGYGSQMNICIDCRILMFRRAKELAERIGAEYLVTGEVLDERPFSQRASVMALIEREAGLEGKVLRPLSGRLLWETELERRGLVRREDLYAIQGRRRIPQIKLAEELGLEGYPSPSGGCLLTDPQFAKRLRDYLSHEGRPKLEEAVLLRFGRHFRVGPARVVVGRNEEENRVLEAMAEGRGITRMRVLGYMGPITLVIGEAGEDTLSMAAGITARYSDAPKDVQVEVLILDGVERRMTVKAVGDEELSSFRI